MDKKEKKPKSKKIAIALLIICAIYIISPIDFIPDLTLIPGRIDDLIAILTAVFALVSLIKKNVRIEGDNQEEYIEDDRED